mgnify:CR=1 FL=1
MKTGNMAGKVGIVGLVLALVGVWSAQAEWAGVQRVIDGDTFVLTDGTRVRVKGIDTPETKHPRIAPEPSGAEASQFARTMLEGRTVWLDGKSTDKYRRRLADVQVGGISYAERIRENGYDKLSRSSGSAFAGIATMPHVPSYTPSSTLYGSMPMDSRSKTEFVNGYFRSNGTYVQPYYRSAPR